MTSRTILAEPGTRPFPGSELTVRVAGDPHPETFFKYGRASVEGHRDALASIGRRLEDYEDILDFGCGCGRMLTWLEPLAKLGPNLHGTDTDADAVAWVREHLPFVEARVNDPLPPLAYADGQFDLVFNHSVFTHLDEERQDAWLLELRRITRLGGHLLLSVHGEHAFARYENAMLNNGGEAIAERETYARDGFYFAPDPGWQEKGFAEWYGAAYHTTRYIFAHWTQWFRIKAYLPQGALGFQDLVVLERVDDGEHHGEYLRQPASVLAGLVAARAGTDPAPTQAEAAVARAEAAVARAEAAVAGAEAADARAEAADARAEAVLARDEDAVARAEAAIARVERLLDRGPQTASASLPRSAWRRALQRAIANYSTHEREVDEALVEALRAQLER